MTYICFHWTGLYKCHGLLYQIPSFLHEQKIVLCSEYAINKLLKTKGGTEAQNKKKKNEGVLYISVHQEPPCQS